MNIGAPKQIVFIIAVVLAVLSLVASQVTHIPVVSGNSYWFMTGAFGLLAAGNLFKGL
jgi:hypothetical protein